MQLTRKRCVYGALATIAVMAVLNPSAANAAVLFDASTGLGGALSTTPHYAQQATLAGPPGYYSITGLSSFGVNWSNVSAGSQDVFLDFYTGADTSPTAADAFSTATFITEKGFGLNAPPANGGYTYTLNFTTPVLVPSNTFDVEVTMTNAAGTAFSTAIGAIFTNGTPSVGSDPGFVWIDSNQDSTFTGTEQSTTAGGGTTANILFKANATAVPEPVSATAFIGLAGVGLGLSRRRRVSTTA